MPESIALLKRHEAYADAVAFGNAEALLKM